jgi:hypothetical protein
MYQKVGGITKKLEQNMACESAQNTWKLSKQALDYEENVNELADAGYSTYFLQPPNCKKFAGILICPIVIGQNNLVSQNCRKNNPPRGSAKGNIRKTDVQRGVVGGGGTHSSTNILRMQSKPSIYHDMRRDQSAKILEKRTIGTYI